MSATLSRTKEWLSVEGHLQPLHNAGLSRLREQGNKLWFVVQNSSLLFYEQKDTQMPPYSKPLGSTDICTSTLEVFVAVTSKDNKEYLLTPGQGVCLTEWLSNLKNKTAFAEKPGDASTLERGQQGSTFMSRVRSSFRRKKKGGRTLSQENTELPMRTTPSPPKHVASGGAIVSPDAHVSALSNRRPLRKLERSLTYPSETEDEAHVEGFAVTPLDKGTTGKPIEVKTFADKACDTMSLEWVMPDLNDSTEALSIEVDGVAARTFARPGTSHVTGSVDTVSDTENPTSIQDISDRELLKQIALRHPALDCALRDACRDDVTLLDPGSDDASALRDSCDDSSTNKGISQLGESCRVDTALRDTISDDTALRDTNSDDSTLCDSGDTKMRDSFERSSAEVLEGILQQIESTDENSKTETEGSGISVESSRDLIMKDLRDEEQSASVLRDNIEKPTPGNLDNEVSANQNSHISEESEPDQPHLECSDDNLETREGRDSKSASPKERRAAGLVSVKAKRISQARELEALKEALTFQQQKFIRELEVEVCKLKCEVISLIQGTIQVPLKDDDLADWHYVEEIRYKDRIFELLREARLCNPKLPNFDSSKSGSFRDGYGFIHGSRESESVVFHYVCRALTQHYSSFYQNKNGHVQFFEEYTKAKKQVDTKILYKEKELKSLVRDGIPGSCRSAVWLSFIYDKVDPLKKAKGRHFYKRQASKTSKRLHTVKSEMSDVERQIKCDLLRTMPTNERFKTIDSPGVISLSRVLHSFADYMPEIGYLQGMNFLVGLFLLFMGEEDAFWALVAVVEIYLKDYFDHFLSGAQADQEVLKELVSEMLPVLYSHFKYYGVDISTVTFNWLITVYLDAVPFETALRIWDCFLFEGREALFRVAIGLLKLQQRSLLQLSGPLEIMQYMKRAARVTYDVDRLFKASFDEITKFPSNEQLDERQRKHIEAIERKHDYKMSVTRQQRKRSRVSSFTVEIPSPEKQEKPDQYQIVECAVATSKDLSSPVCILCSSRGAARLYLLDINKKEMSTLEAGISCRVLCAEVLEDGTLLVGTISWFVHAFSIDFREELWSVQLRDSVIDLSHYYLDESDNKVYAALADGSIAVLPNANAAGPPSEGSHVRIGNAPVTCVTIVGDKVWCGCGNNLVVLDSSSLEELHSTVVSPIQRHQVARLLAGEHGVWCNIRGSSWVALINPDTYEFLLKVDVSLDTGLIDTANQSQVTVSPFQESRVTTVMVFNEELWVGLGNGQVMIFDVIENDKYEEESFVLLKREASLDKGEDGTKEHSRESANAGTFPSTMTSDSPTRERAPSSETVSSECRFTLKLRTFYRISEEAIRSLVLLRETDPMVLSCAGTLSAEGGLSLWQQQPSGPECTEWLPCSIKHKIRKPTESPASAARKEATALEASI